MVCVVGVKEVGRAGRVGVGVVLWLFLRWRLLRRGAETVCLPWVVLPFSLGRHFVGWNPVWELQIPLFVELLGVWVLV